MQEGKLIFLPFFSVSGVMTCRNHLTAGVSGQLGGIETCLPALFSSQWPPEEPVSLFLPFSCTTQGDKEHEITLDLFFLSPPPVQTPPR